MYSLFHKSKYRRYTTEPFLNRTTAYNTYKDTKKN